jgi:hypothetical protein
MIETPPPGRSKSPAALDRREKRARAALGYHAAARSQLNATPKHERRRVGGPAVRRVLVYFPRPASSRRKRARSVSGQSLIQPNYWAHKLRGSRGPADFRARAIETAAAGSASATPGSESAVLTE